MDHLKIRKITIEPISILLDEPFTIAIGKKHSIESVLLILELNNGIQGFGEAAPLEPVNGENQATVLATLNSIREFLLDKDVSSYKTIARHLKNVFWAQAAARCAVEMAMLDAFTRSLNIPLYRFFGGATGNIETDYTVDIVSPDIAARNAAKLAGKGYRTLKTKVGKDLVEDIERLLAIRHGAPGCTIIIDANQGFSPPEAVYFLEELEKNDIRPGLFEQPVLKGDFAGMKYVRDRTSIPVAADESVFTAADAVNIIRTGCADVINIKLMKSGIVEALDIAALARSANLKLMTGCMLETRLGLGCAVHLAAGLGCFDFVDLDPHLRPEQDPFNGGPAFIDPVYSIDDQLAGIGISLK